jgi:hypothetical protein
MFSQVNGAKSEVQVTRPLVLVSARQGHYHPRFTKIKLKAQKRMGFGFRVLSHLQIMIFYVSSSNAGVSHFLITWLSPWFFQSSLILPG